MPLGTSGQGLRALTSLDHHFHDFVNVTWNVLLNLESTEGTPLAFLRGSTLREASGGRSHSPLRATFPPAPLEQFQFL